MTSSIAHAIPGETRLEVSQPSLSSTASAAPVEISSEPELRMLAEIPGLYGKVTTIERAEFSPGRLGLKVSAIRPGRPTVSVPLAPSVIRAVMRHGAAILDEIRAFHAAKPIRQQSAPSATRATEVAPTQHGKVDPSRLLPR